MQDGALKLSGTMSKLTTTVAMLNMSFCDVKLCGGSKLLQDFFLHEGLNQLYLSGNQLEERVGAFSVYQLRHFLF